MPTRRSVAATASPPIPAPTIAIDGFFLAISTLASAMRPTDRARGASRPRWRTVPTLSSRDPLRCQTICGCVAARGNHAVAYAIVFLKCDPYRATASTGTARSPNYGRSIGDHERFETIDQRPVTRPGPMAEKEGEMANPAPMRLMTYEQVVERYELDILKEPGDLVLKDGDIALTKGGLDLMLNSPEYHAMFRRVQAWRYNAPTLQSLFDLVFSIKLLREALDNQMRTTALAPIANYHQLNDEIRARESAYFVYAGSVVLALDRKSTRLNSSHGYISYAVFCLKKKNTPLCWLSTRKHQSSLDSQY